MRKLFVLSVAVVFLVVFSGISEAANPQPSMYTLDNIYYYLVEGTEATWGAHSLGPQSGAPGQDITGFTKSLEDIYYYMSDSFSECTAGPDSVLEGVPFFCTQLSGNWGVQTGTMLSSEVFDDMLIDVFIDADGANNTIDTGNTTALFFTDKYKNFDWESPTTDGHGKVLATFGGPTTVKYGMGITTKTKQIRLTKVTKSGSGATKSYILASDKTTILSQADYVGNEATHDIVLDASTIYYILNDAAGGSYQKYGVSSASYPYDETNFEWTTGFGSGEEYSEYVLEIVSIDTGAYAPPTDRIVQTNALTIDTNPIAVQVFATNETGGTVEVTFDFKIGTNDYQTGNALNTKILNSDTGSTITLKLNLNGVDFPNTAEASDYAIMLWY